MDSNCRNYPISDCFVDIFATQNIVNVTWKSMTYDPQSHRSERIFLCSLVTLVSPILRFHDITSYDVILSVIALLVAVIGFTLNERHLSKKK